MKEFHALAAEYPLLPESELQVIVNSMAANGYDPSFPIVLFQKQILDGRNRALAAEKAKRRPVYVEFEGTEDEARQFVITANENRRHLTAEWLTQKRAERIERVAEARREGESLRIIAEAENVSESQVRRDLKAATAPGGGAVEPEDGKVTGRDGRTRTATPEKPPPDLCSRCQRLAPGAGIKDCPNCKELRDHKAPRTTSTKPAPAESKPPKNGQVTYNDQVITDLLGKLAKEFCERSKSHGGETNEYAEMRRHWEALNTAWKRWTLKKERKPR